MAEAPKAVITGASSGIGYAFAEHYAARGYEVHLVARRKALLDDASRYLHQKHGVPTEILAANLATVEGLESAMNYCRALSPEVLVNNAGLAYTQEFSSLPEQDLRLELDLDFTAQILLSRSVIKGMRERRSGTIILVSSLAAEIPADNDSGYVAAKAGLNAFAESLQYHVAKSGIRVMAICPGFVRTNIYRASGSEDPDLPSWLWSEPNQIVKGTARAQNSGRAVIIPRWHDRVLSGLWAALPRPARRFIAERMYS